MEEVSELGYKDAKYKLGKIKSQCTQCEKAVCKNHSEMVCRSCTSNLYAKEEQPEQSIDEN